MSMMCNVKLSYGSCREVVKLSLLTEMLRNFCSSIKHSDHSRNWLFSGNHGLDMSNDSILLKKVLVNGEENILGEDAFFCGQNLSKKAE